MRGRYTRARLFLFFMLVFGYPAPSIPKVHALDGTAPVITAITPDKGAAGHGQLVTIHGVRLDPERTEVVFTQGKDSENAFVYKGASSPDELYVRMPFSLKPGAATVTVKTSDENMKSNALKFMVTKKPSAPVPRRLFAAREGYSEITSASPGDTVGVASYGADTSGATAVFTQGATKISVRGTLTSSRPDIGVVSQFVVPSRLRPGPASVQLRVTVNKMDSDLSRPLVFRVNP